MNENCYLLLELDLTSVEDQNVIDQRIEENVNFGL